jgi:hypothetical protein
MFIPVLALDPSVGPPPKNVLFQIFPARFPAPGFDGFLHRCLLKGSHFSSIRWPTVEQTEIRKIGISFTRKRDFCGRTMGRQGSTGPKQPKGTNEKNDLECFQQSYRAEGHLIGTAAAGTSLCSDLRGIWPTPFG